MNLNFLGDLGKYLWPVLKSQSSTISDTGDPTKCSKGPYQIWKWKEITQKDHPDSSFSKHNIEIMSIWNLWEQALRYKDVQGLFEDSLWFGKFLKCQIKEGIYLKSNCC